MGNVLFTIVLQKIDSLVGRVLKAVLNSGKVKKRQEVVIKLDNYPYAEWGSIKGEIVIFLKFLSKMKKYTPFKF